MVHLNFILIEAVFWFSFSEIDFILSATSSISVGMGSSQSIKKLLWCCTLDFGEGWVGRLQKSCYLLFFLFYFCYFSMSHSLLLDAHEQIKGIKSKAQDAKFILIRVHWKPEGDKLQEVLGNMCKQKETCDFNKEISAICPLRNLQQLLQRFTPPHFSSRAVSCTWKNIPACDHSMQRAGHTHSPEIRFFQGEHCMVVVLALQLAQAGHGESGNPILQLCWCWIAWTERELAPGAQHMGSSHGWKVNVQTLCWTANSGAGGKACWCWILMGMGNCTGVWAEGQDSPFPPGRANFWNHPETFGGK